MKAILTLTDSALNDMLEFLEKLNPENDNDVLILNCIMRKIEEELWMRDETGNTIL